MSENSNNKKIIEEKSSLAGMVNHLKISGLTEKWKKLSDAASSYEQMSEEERSNAGNTIFDPEQFENLVSDTYDVLAPYAFDSQVPKCLLDLYATIRSFTKNEYFKKTKNGVFQFRIAIAEALYHLLDQRCELSDETRAVVFYLDENQSISKSGYYIYNFDTLYYNYIGKENPLA